MRYKIKRSGHGFHVEFWAQDRRQKAPSHIAVFAGAWELLTPEERRDIIRTGGAVAAQRYVQNSDVQRYTVKDKV